MNKNIAKPLVIHFTPPEASPRMGRNGRSIYVPVNTQWDVFKNNVLPLVASTEYDSVLVRVKEDVDRDARGVMGSMTIKLNALSGAGSRSGKPVLTYESMDKPFYIVNPTKEEEKSASFYAPSDETIMDRYNSYGSKDAWQEHQSKIWARMKETMPLSRKTDNFSRNHAAQLKDPKRGLKEPDLEKFWSFKSGCGVSPILMGDDMVGFPSMEGRDYDGFTFSLKQPDGTTQTKPFVVRSLKTTGSNGIMIPMANANGHVAKHQIGTDLTAYGTELKMRAEDGRTVSKKGVFNKTTREYGFTFEDGTESHLKVKDVSPENVITMQDAKGIFNVRPKQEISEVLKNRGYVIPEIVHSIKADASGKYMWQAPGTMTGSQKVRDIVSPSDPGFIRAREPKNGRDDYVMLIAEGALKGHIVAKYIDVTDEKGVCFGDKIAGDRGIIIMQVPGVSLGPIKNVASIYDKFNIAGTFIAMDADGRENKNVANGIHNAYDFLNEKNRAKVLSWDPAQKGLDDALLAVAQRRITIDDMNLLSGTADALFPRDKAKKMTPYDLNGKEGKLPSWLEEYRESAAEKNKKIAQMQEETAKREKAVEEKEEKTSDAASEVEKKEPPAKESESAWVETPADIESLKDATIAKAKEMDDALAGNLPPAKQESAIAPTPDPEEFMEEEDQDEDFAKELPEIKEAAEEVDRKAEAVKWDQQNPAMQPLTPPEGYKTTYAYKQPVVGFDPSISKLPNDSVYEDKESWGIVAITTKNPMSIEEKAERQNALKDQNVECIGNMRLVSQTITRADGIEKKQTIDDGMVQ